MNVWVGPVYWKLQLAGRTTREQAVGGGPKATSQGETSASCNFPQTGHRTTDEEQLYLQHTLRLFCAPIVEFYVTWYSHPDAVEYGLRSNVIGLWIVLRYLQSEEATDNDCRTARSLYINYQLDALTIIYS